MTEPAPNNIKRVRIKGFKSIAALDLPMRNINILIGAHGSGKSNFLSLFTFLNSLSKGKLRSHVAREGGAERFFHFGTKRTQNITLDLEVDRNGYHAAFSPNADDDSLFFEEEYCTVAGSNRRWNLKPQQGESGFAATAVGEVAVAREQGSPSEEDVVEATRKHLEGCRVYHFHDTSPQAKFKKACGLENNHFLESDAANIAPFLYRLREEHPGYYKDIVLVIKTIAPFFHDFHLQPSGKGDDAHIRLQWIHANAGRDAPQSANALSEGIARFVCLATLLIQPKDTRPDTIILDKPELGLHPDALEVLANSIQVTARKTQVVCSTQSSTLANYFDPEDFVVVEVEDGVSSFKRLERAGLERWLERYGMGSIWAMNLVGGNSA